MVPFYLLLLSVSAVITLPISFSTAWFGPTFIPSPFPSTCQTPGLSATPESMLRSQDGKNASESTAHPLHHNIDLHYR
ncbi:hypothetical protein EDD22DRAFT_175212 [Suillus occidentalis]|nr:hypothetical protein EDD22DRAFT_175212 [Suillus occidentalis]